MMKNNKIYKKFQEDFQKSNFIRVGENRNLSLYIGRDDNARYSFDFRGQYSPVKISSSDVITIEQYKNDNVFTLRFSLENNDLLEYFCIFCQDLLDSVKTINDDENAYNILRSCYYAWKQLFRPNNTSMTETSIMGLIGELLFLQNYLIPKKGIDIALQSWMGPEKTHKDFSNEQEWFEIKTVNSGKRSIKISSIEQLDSNTDGYLIVYELEKMSPSFDGIKLNQLVNSIIALLENISQREIFMGKLKLYNFNFTDTNDNIVFSLQNKYIYKVDTINFPRIRKDILPNAITRVQYELSLTEIEPFKLK